MYNCVGGAIIGFSVRILLASILGTSQDGRDEGLLVYLKGKCGSLSGSNDVRGRVELEMVFNKIWGSGEK